MSRFEYASNLEPGELLILERANSGDPLAILPADSPVAFVMKTRANRCAIGYRNHPGVEHSITGEFEEILEAVELQIIAGRLAADASHTANAGRLRAAIDTGNGSSQKQPAKPAQGNSGRQGGRKGKA